MTDENQNSVEQARTLLYLVVVNDEEQYSIWSQDRELPAGWRHAGFAGSRDACLSHIETVWTNILPKSVRIASSGLGDYGSQPG